jgi:hypothetical protein
MIALIAELVGITTSFAVYVSPSAIAGILAALSYVLALQMKRARNRVKKEIPEAGSGPENVAEILGQPAPDVHTHNDESAHNT